MEDAVLTGVLEASKTLLKYLGAAVVLTSAGWFTVEWLLFPLKREIEKRYAAVFCCILMVMLAHGSNLIDFGSGPAGWMGSFLLGFIAGGLAPKFHEAVIGRWLPFLRRSSKSTAP